MWLSGQGYVRTGNAGQALKRTPYDPATMRVSRRVFESDPVVSEGLQVAPRKVDLVPGPPLDLGQISDLSRRGRGQVPRAHRPEANCRR